MALADDSKVDVRFQSTRKGKWFGAKVSMNAHLSGTLVVLDMALSPLFIPALTRKNISVIFMPSKGFMIDFEGDLCVLGKTVQADNGLYYIPDSESAASVKMSRAEKRNAFAMMAIARSHAEGIATPFPELESKDVYKVDDHVTPTEADSVQSVFCNSNVAVSEDKSISEQEKSVAIPDWDQARLWHQRLGHAVPS